MHLQSVAAMQPVTNLELYMVVNALEDLYSPLKEKLSSMPDGITYRQFKRLVVGELEWDSSPGLPFSRYYTLNKDLFGWNGVTVDDAKTKVVYAALQQRFRELARGPALDPIALFVKPEPHKLSKRDKQAWRIIHNVSIIDNLVCRVLLGRFFSRSIELYRDIPSKAGWAPSSGGYAWLLNQLPGMKLMADKSAWDFTCQGWVVEAFAGLIDRLYPDSTPETKTILGHHLSALFGSCTLSIGPARIKQRTRGVLKSGWYGTIGFNSVAQVALHVLAAIRLKEDWRVSVPHSLGDDTVQTALVPPGYLEMIQRGGCIVKEHLVATSIQFGGHEFEGSICVPLYSSKHVWMLLHLDPAVAAEALETYQYLYALSPPMLSIVQSLLKDLGEYTRIRSQDRLNAWYHGWESLGSIEQGPRQRGPWSQGLETPWLPTLRGGLCMAEEVEDLR